MKVLTQLKSLFVKSKSIVGKSQTTNNTGSPKFLSQLSVIRLDIKEGFYKAALLNLDALIEELRASA